VPRDRARATDDELLLAAAKNGDGGALESLLRRYYDLCYGICRRLLGNDQDALDATQEAMIAVVRSFGGFDGRSAFSTWIYRVATNAALDELRRRGRRPVLGRVVLASEDASPLDPVVTSPHADDVGDIAAARVSLDWALSRLSEEHRAAVVLRDMLDLDYAEIAEVLGVPIGTVRSRIARGRAALADAMEPEASPTSRRLGVTGSQRNRAGSDGVQGC
jgi:RNA polymerase sigma-70 factor (ECF subfamily)